MSKTLAILTGGGDCPGLNAVIRAVVRTACGRYAWRVIGIEDGFEGLVAPLRWRELAPKMSEGFSRVAAPFWAPATKATPSAFHRKSRAKLNWSIFRPR